MIKSLGIGGRQIRVSISTLALISSVTLNKLLNLSELLSLLW